MAAPVHPYSDYGVALRTLKSARGWLSALLVICVFTQFIGFGFLYWTSQPYEAMNPRLTASPTWLDELAKRLHTADTQSANNVTPQQEWFPSTHDGYNLNVRRQWDLTYLVCVPITQLLGLIAVCSMTLLIFMTLQVTLVAQAPGVAQMTRSLIWMVVLLFMVFPWQVFFSREFRIPGLLYGYRELLEMLGPFVAKNYTDPIFPFQRFLVIVRFVFWPVIGLIVQILAGERFRAGIMLAIGHPLQSIMQPRAATPLASPKPGSPTPAPLGKR